MKRQLFNTSKKPVIRSDNGPQFVSNLFEETCVRFGVTHERIPVKTPNKNAHIESFHAILEQECYQYREFETYQQAYLEVSQFIRFYNTNRIHGSIYDLSPYQYIDAIKAGLVKAKEIRV